MPDGTESGYSASAIVQMNGPTGDGRADLGGQTGDRPGLVGVDRLLHLHRLEDDDQVAGLDGGAVLDRDLDDRALHRRGQGVARCTRAAVAGAALARLGGHTGGATPAGGEAGGEGHLEAPSAHLDHDGLPRGLLGGLGRGGVVGRDLVVPLGLDPARVHGERLAGEGLVADDGPVERNHRRHALDDQLVQGPAGALQRLLAGGPGDDELGQHRVEGAGHLAAGLHAGVPPHARALRDLQPLHRSGRGHEVAAGVLGVDPELDAVPARRRVLGDLQLAGRRRCGTAAGPGRCRWSPR